MLATNPDDWTEAEIDQLLARFDQTPLVTQRKLIARLLSDRTRLLEAAKRAAASSWDRVLVQRVLGDVIERVERTDDE